MSDYTILKACARCGQDHGYLDIWPLANARGNWSHYTTCPTTDQPVMLRIGDGPNEPIDGHVIEAVAP